MRGSHSARRARRSWSRWRVECALLIVINKIDHLFQLCSTATLAVQFIGSALRDLLGDDTERSRSALAGGAVAAGPSVAKARGR